MVFYIILIEKSHKFYLLGEVTLATVLCSRGIWL